MITQLSLLDKLWIIASDFAFHGICTLCPFAIDVFLIIRSASDSGTKNFFLNINNFF